MRRMLRLSSLNPSENTSISASNSTLTGSHHDYQCPLPPCQRETFHFMVIDTPQRALHCIVWNRMLPIQLVAFYRVGLNDSSLELQVKLDEEFSQLIDDRRLLRVFVFPRTDLSKSHYLPVNLHQIVRNAIQILHIA